MGWTERQVAMLAEMGLRVPPAPKASKSMVAAVETSAEVATIEPPREPTRETPQAAPVAAPRQPPREAAPTRIELAQPVAPLHSAFTDLDWPALREAAAGCTACGLCQGRTQAVFGIGSQQAHWMIVGDAPSEADDASGEPFAASAGKLLDNMLAAIGVSRVAGDESGRETPIPASRAYLTQTVKCRPPGNRNPTPAELAACAPYLARQVDLLRPKIILAMGPVAVQSLLRTDEPIGRLRGKVHRFHDVPVVATYHPTYLLRNHLADKARVWDDLCLARQALLASK